MPELMCMICARLQQLYARGMGFYLVIGTETAVVNKQCLLQSIINVPGRPFFCKQSDSSGLFYSIRRCVD